MAYLDLRLGQGDGTRSDNFLGYAYGISKSEPSGGTKRLTGNEADPTATYVSWMEDSGSGPYRIKIANAAAPDLTAGTVATVGGTQVYNPIGGCSVLGDQLGNVAMHSWDADNIFWGNILFKPGLGLNAAGNNIHCATYTQNGTISTGGYMFYCGIQTDAGVSAMDPAFDEPEGFQMFHNTGNDPTQLLTFHGTFVSNEEAGSKYMLMNAGTTDTGCSNTSVTIYRGYSYASARSPLLGDGMTVDICNWVQPLLSFQQEGMIFRRSMLGDIRGCSIDDSTPVFTAIQSENANTSMYYVTSGGGNDNNEELNTPTITWDGSNPFSSSQAGSYTGKPTIEAMDSTLRAEVLAADNTTHAITIEGEFAGISANMVLCDVSEWRWKDWMKKINGWKRYVPHGGYWTWDWDWRYPGLSPEVELNQTYAPGPQFFALGGI